MRLIQLILILITSINLSAITLLEADSLQKVVSTTKNDSLKVSVLNKLSFHYVFNDKVKAEQLLRQSEKIAISKNLKHGYNEILYTKGVIHDISGRKDSARYYFSKALNYSRVNNHKVIEVRCLNGLGMNSWNNAKYKDAINLFFRALQLNDKLNEKEQLSPSIFYNNIGLIYLELKLYEKSLDYHLKAFEIRKKQNLVKDMVSSLNNIGICYSSTQREKLAVKAFQEGMELAVSSGNYIDYYKIINNLADTYNMQKEYSKSVKLLESAINKPEVTYSNPRNMILGFGKLSIAYSKLNQPDKAISIAEKGLELFRKDSTLRSLTDDLYFALTMSYYLKKDLEKAEFYQVKYFEELRRNFSKDNNLAIAEMEVKYETQKKESALQISVEKLKTQKTFTAFSLTLVLLFLVVVYLFFQNRDKKARLRIARQESRVAGLLVEAEQKERSRIARDLHDGVSQKLAVIQMHLSMAEDTSGMQNVNNLLQQTITDVRGISHNLYPPDLDKGLIPALSHLCDQNNFINKKTAFILDIDNLPEKIMLRPNIEHLIFRVVQEITNNALKYAQATKVEIKFRYLKNQLLLKITDDGIGFDNSAENSKNGIGLKNITERVSQIGGETEITSAIGSGTSFHIKIPL